MHQRPERSENDCPTIRKMIDQPRALARGLFSYALLGHEDGPSFDPAGLPTNDVIVQKRRRIAPQRHRLIPSEIMVKRLITAVERCLL
ncbi:MAG: hypothetical protein D6741_03805 [Planctomycetota bacterium]|nr:MAG: hypothetical protein D6741_03805 [Planctomycetota bacterium]